MSFARPPLLWPESALGSWTALTVLAAVAQAVLWSISEPTDLFSDFYKAYFPAGERVWQDGAVPTWEIPGTATVGFVNLPILAWLFVPLAWIGKDLAGWVFLALGAAAVATTYALLLRLGDFGRTGGAMLALSILANGPLVNSLREGNTTHFILLLLVVALLLWRAGANFAAGLVLGCCALIKLPLLLFGVYALLRGHWRLLAGGATITGAVGLISLAVFGLEINTGWYRACVAPFANGVIPAFNVQSIDGFLGRLDAGTSLLMEWTPLAMPLWHKITRAIVLTVLFVAVFTVMLMRKDDAEEPRFARNAREFSLVLVLAVTTSPLSWSHYYLLLLLPWALYLAGRLGLAESAATRAMMAGGIVLSALPVVALPLEPGLAGDILARTAVSAWLAGGLLMLAALICGAYKAAPQDEPPQPAQNP